MNENYIIQCVLRHRATNAFLVCWLNADKRLKVGKFVTLQDYEPEKRWEVMSMGAITISDSIISSHNSDIIHKKDFVRNNKGGFKNVGKK